MLIIPGHILNAASRKANKAGLDAKESSLKANAAGLDAKESSLKSNKVSNV